MGGSEVLGRFSPAPAVPCGQQQGGFPDCDTVAKDVKFAKMAVERSSFSVFFKKKRR